MNKVIENLNSIKEKIKKVPEKFHIKEIKPPEIIAVSKTFGGEHIIPLLEHGHVHYGENRVQEALSKWPELKKRFPNTKLHLIGPLQTNKIKEALEVFDVIHTVDREKLAVKLKEEMEKQKTNLPVFIQVNTGEEEQKAGITPKEADGFIKFCKELRLNVIGLMCIPPIDEEPSFHFALLKKIVERNNLTNLSMGMSSDYEKAAALGSTHLRIGSLIFGEREYKEKNDQAGS